MKSLFTASADEATGTSCHCARLSCTTRCLDCLQSPMTCDLCFIDAHKNNPTHWAERWNGDYFVRHDISDLDHVITLGHNGNPCPCVDYKDLSNTRKFTLADVNGIHSTIIAFCKCARAGGYADQLMAARVFPASVTRPTTGFTFSLLETFHLECLESKKSAYDYIEALRRRTNNAFPSDVPVSCQCLDTL
jgi:hypothetical protein